VSQQTEKSQDAIAHEHTAEQHSLFGREESKVILPLDPFPWYRTMRETRSVRYNQEGKTWEIFRYEDVFRVVNDHAAFSSEQVMREQPQTQRDQPQTQREQSQNQDEEFARSLLSTDPPRHRHLRSLISQAFTPRTIAQLTPRITEIVDDYLERVATGGRMDVIADLSYPLPVIVIAEMLGIPSAERDQFKRWSDAIVSTAREEAMQAGREMNRYFKKIIDQRRIEPRDDLISSLIATQVEGEHLTESELLSFCVLLLVAGNETTTNLLGNAIICFDEHPEVMEQLRDDPALIPSAIEEVLRYLSPVQLLVRVATSDIVLGGQEIKAGQFVVPWLGAANRDEAQFPDPDTFDIRRAPNRHVAFGHGIHFCIGAPLARLETKIALGAILERFSEIRRDRTIPIERIPSSFVYGVKQLPITFRTR